MNIDEQVSKIIEEFGVPDVLRAITRFALAQYEKYSRQRMKKLMESPAQTAAELSPFYESPRDERREDDLSAAWMTVDCDYIAKSYERRVAEAGMSRDEIRERNRKAEIAQLKTKLAELERP